MDLSPDSPLGARERLHASEKPVDTTNIIGSATHVSLLPSNIESLSPSRQATIQALLEDIIECQKKVDNDTDHNSSTRVRRILHVQDLKDKLRPLTNLSFEELTAPRWTSHDELAQKAKHYGKRNLPPDDGNGTEAQPRKRSAFDLDVNSSLRRDLPSRTQQSKRRASDAGGLAYVPRARKTGHLKPHPAQKSRSRKLSPIASLPPHPKPSDR